MSRAKDSISNESPTMDPGAAMSQGRPQFSIPDLLQLYRQTLYMAVKEADLSAAGTPFEEDGLAEIRADLDNWNNIEFDPPGCLRLSKKSGACQKIVSYWKKLLGSILTDRDPTSFGNHDRGVMTICKLLHKDFQIAVTAISKWNERDFPNIPTDQVKEKLSMNQLTFLCRRYHNDLTLIAHAFKSSVSSTDFKYLNPRLTETYPIKDEPEYENIKEENTSPTVTPSKPAEKRKRPVQVKHERNSSNADSLGLSMATMYGNMDMEPRLAQFSDALHNSPLPSPLDPTKAFFLQSQYRRNPPAHPQQTQPILKSLLPKSNGHREREQEDEPLDLGRHQSRPAVAHHNGHGSASVNGSGQKEGKGDANDLLVQKLRAKNKKYVGMIMNLVQQIVGSGQVPFLDLRCIDPEDREEMSSGQTSGANNSPRFHSAEQNRSANKPAYSPHLQTQTVASNSAPVRRKTQKQVPNVSFDQTTMRWNTGQPNGIAHSSTEADGRRNVPPTVRSTLSSLLSEPVLGHFNPNKHFTQINGSAIPGDVNGHSSSKSKRKNNPVKRELPGYAPHLTSSPDVGGSDDANSVGSGDGQAKNVKASLFVPPVETTYVESRGVNGLKRASPDDNMARQVAPLPAPVNKRKCSIQSMADNLLFANGGLSALGVMPEALPTEVPDSVSGPWLAPGSCVFAKLQDGVLFPAEIVEKVSNGYVVAWLHDSFSSTVAIRDIFALDEVFTEKRSVMVKMREGHGEVDDGNYHLAAFLDPHRDGWYSVFTNWGDVVRCRLQDIIVVLMENPPRILDGSFGSRMEEAAEKRGSFEISSTVQSSPKPNMAPRIISKKMTPQLESNDALRNTCFLITWQKTSVLKGYDDEHLSALIRASGGAVVKTFEELVVFDGEKFLVAPCTCSTPKFFQCLAANIPCVSYQWVIDCYSAKTRCSYQDNLLPAGIEKDEVIFWHPRDFMFRQQKIGLYSDSMDFFETWLLALKAGGVVVSTLGPDHISEELANVDIIIADGICPETIREAAESAGVTIVNENWLRSSLIHGKLQDWDQAEFMPAFD